MDVRGCLGLDDEVPQRLHAHPRRRSASRATRRRRSCARSSSARRRAPPCSTWSPTACRSTSTSSPSCTARVTRCPSSCSAPARPRARRLVALAEALARRARAPRAGEHDRDGTLPAREHRARCARAGYFAAPIPERARRARRRRPCTTSSSPPAGSPAATRRVAIGVNMHMAALLNIVRRWRMATAAGDARRAAAFGGARWTRRPRRRRHRRRGQRAGPGPHPPGDDRRPRTDARLAHRRPQDLLHDVAGGDHALHVGHLHRRRRRRSATATRMVPARTRRASSSTTTGTRWACAPPAATR